MSRFFRTVVGASLLWSFAAAPSAWALHRAAGKAQPVTTTDAPAATPAPAPTPTPTPAEAAPAAPPTGELPLTAKVLAVTGKVRHRTGPDQPWQMTKVGDEVGEGTQFQTVPMAAVRIRVGENHELTIDRLTTLNLRSARTDAQTERTRVDVPYGRVAFNVASGSKRNDVEIQAPDATLAVKGTQGLLEVTPGQPTFAAGGDRNTGTFTVSYDTGKVGTVEGELETSIDNPDPAVIAVIDTSLDTGISTAREPDEAAVVDRSTGGGDAPSLSTGTGGGGAPINRTLPPPAATEFFYLADGGARNGQLIRVRLPDIDESRFDSPDFLASYDQTLGPGAAGLAVQSTATGRRLVRLEQRFGGGAFVGWRLLGLAPDASGSVFSLITSNTNVLNEPSFFGGLAAIGPRLFTAGFLPTAGQSLNFVDIFELSGSGPDAGTSSIRMSLPLSNVGRDLGGVTARGSLYIFGQTAFQNPGGFLGGGFVEIDPRSNAVLSVADRLTVGPSTVFDPPTLSSLNLNAANVAGVTEVGGTLVAELHIGATTVYAVIRPSAAGTAADPTIIRVQQRPDRSTGLAGEAGGTPPAPFNLSPGVGTTAPNLPSFFANVGYTVAAAQRPTLITMARDVVLDSARGFSACQATPELSSALPARLLARAGVTRGFGLAIGDFYNELLLGHPCLPFGVTGLIPGPLFLDSAASLFTLEGDTPRLLFPISGTQPLGNDFTGLAIQNDGPTRKLLRLESSETAFSGPGYRLLALALDGQSRNTVTLTNASSGNLVLSGLGTLGNRIFSSGEDLTTPEFDYQIVELFSGTPAPTVRMSVPLFDAGFDLAGANERGSVFILGQSTDATSSRAIFELDPRNNAFRRVIPLAIGTGSVLIDITSATANALLNDPAVVATGLAWDGSRLVLTLEDVINDETYLVRLNPDAAGTSADPSITRVAPIQLSFDGSLALEANVAPAAPINFATAAGTVDPFIDALFAAAGFTTQAAGQTAFRQLVIEAIADSVSDPVACRAAVSPSGIGAFLNARTNTASGIGLAVADYRNTLSPGHPCLPGGVVMPTGGPSYWFNTSTREAFASPGGTPPIGISSAITTLTPAAILRGEGVAASSASTLGGVNLPGDGLLRLEIREPTPGIFERRLVLTPFDSPARTGIAPVGFQIGFSTGSPIERYEGLATVGGQAYTALGLSGINFPQDLSFHQLTIGAGSTLNFFPEGSLPVDNAFPRALGGAPARGSVFTLADLTVDLGTPNVLDATLIEFDPRNQAVLGLTPITLGPETLTSGPAFSLANANILGLAFSGDTATISLESGGLFALMQVRVDAALPSGATVTRLDVQPGAIPGIPIGELGSEVPSPVPPPFAVFAPSSQPDPIFSFAYPLALASSPILHEYLRQGVIQTAADGPNCASSITPAAIASFASGFANAQQGAGHAVAAFRLSLNLANPCLSLSNQLQRADAIYVLPGGSLRGRDAGGNDVPLPTVFPINTGIEHLGLATRFSGPTRQLLALEVNAGLYTLTAYPLIPGAGSGTLLDSNTIPSGNLRGLAAVGSDIWSLDPVFRGLLRLEDAAMGGGFLETVRLRTDSLQPGLAGSTPLDSVYAALTLPNTPGSFLDRLRLVRVQAGFALAEQVSLSPTPDTFIDPAVGADYLSADQVVGIAALPNGNVLLSVRLAATSETVFVTVNPTATNGTGDPVVLSVISSVPNAAPGELAGDDANPPGPPAIVVAPGARSVQLLDGELSQARLVYSGLALETASAMISDYLIANAVSPGSCQALLTPLVASAANANQDTFNGFAQAVNQVYDTVPWDHPCARPLINQFRYSMSESVSPAVFVRNGNLTIVSTDPLAGTLPLPIDPNATGAGARNAGGLAILPSLNSAGIADLLRLEVTDLGGSFDVRLLRRPGDIGLINPNTEFTPFANETYAFPISGMAVLSSLPSLGGTIYFSGITGANGDSTIFERTGAGSLSPRINFPRLGGFIGSSILGIHARNERGTILIPSSIRTFSILEVDPRNNYLVDSFSVDNGQLAFTGDTQDNAGLTNLNSVNAVTAIGSSQGLATVSILNASNNRVDVQLSLFGDNSTGNPVVRRTDSIANNEVLQTAGRLTPLPPPATLSNPGGAIDLRGLNATFANMAYNQRVIDNGMARALIGQAILDSAQNSASCAVSAEFTGSTLTTAIQGRVNQVAGAGRAITDFRNAVGPAHPCSPP